MSHTKIQNSKFKIQNSKGISLLFTVLITSFILAIGLGISALLIQGMRMMSKIGYSVTAFYAADSGIEEALYDLYTSSTSSPPSPYHSGDLDDAHYDTEAECCDPNSVDCSLKVSTSTPSGCPLCPFTTEYINPDCDALNYCLKSAGSYQNVKRAIEIKY